MASEIAWGDTDIVINAALNYVARAGPQNDGACWLLYGARALNAHIQEQALHIETKEQKQIRLTLSLS